MDAAELLSSSGNKVPPGGLLNTAHYPNSYGEAAPWWLPQCWAGSNGSAASADIQSPAEREGSRSLLNAAGLPAQMPSDERPENSVS